MDDINREILQCVSYISNYNPLEVWLRTLFIDDPSIPAAQLPYFKSMKKMKGLNQQKYEKDIF